eukprot:5280252-Ditylum_brightwellii.AAC.1
MFTVQYMNKNNGQEPLVLGIIKLGHIDQEQGFQLYDAAHLALPPSKNTSVTKSSKDTKPLQQMTPCNTMVQCIEVFYRFVMSNMSQLMLQHEEHFNIDLTTSALFNGLTAINFPDNQMYKQAYINDIECQWLLMMLKDPSKISQ